MKTILFAFLLISASCTNNPPDYKRTGTDSVFTSTNVVFDLIGGEYRTVTALKIIFDNSRISSKDSTRVEWFRDSVYQIRLSVTDKDSLGRFKYDSTGIPLKKLYWQNVDKQFILEDYNKKWPLVVGKEGKKE